MSTTDSRSTDALGMLGIRATRQLVPLKCSASIWGANPLTNPTAQMSWASLPEIERRLACWICGLLTTFHVVPSEYSTSGIDSVVPCTTHPTAHRFLGPNAVTPASCASKWPAVATCDQAEPSQCRARGRVSRAGPLSVSSVPTAHAFPAEIVTTSLRELLTVSELGLGTMFQAEPHARRFAAP